MKICRVCGEAKPATEFYRARSNRDGLQRDCKACRRASVRDYRLRNIEQVRERDRLRADPEVKREVASEWYYANRERALLSRKQYYANEYRERAIANAMVARARKAGAAEIERFTREEIIDRDGCVCHVCGLEVPRAEIELDHVIPLAAGGPHTRANVKVAHKKCNAERRFVPTHCPQGHPYDEANTYVRPADGARQCRACARERSRKSGGS